MNLTAARRSGEALLREAFAHSTLSRRDRIQQQLREMHSDPVALIGAWLDAGLAPSTLATYVAVLRGVVTPEQRPLLATALRAAKKRAPIRLLNRAVAATSNDILRAMRFKSELKWTILLLWASASRFADLSAMTITSWPDPTSADWTIVQLAMGEHKSDIFGVRCVSKWLRWPTKLVHKVTPQTWPSYGTLSQFLKTVNPKLTLHSCRRGAATTLASLGFEDATIQKITGHTPTEDAHLAVRRYRDPCPSQPEAQTILRMSGALLEPIWKVLKW